MKVDSKMSDDAGRIGSLAGAEPLSRTARGDGAARARDAGDTVQVSRAASDLARAARAVSETPDAQAAGRAERVQRLQQVAKSGDLAVDIQALAHKILSDERGLQ